MRAAIVQMRSGIDPAANAATLARAIAEAAAGGAGIVFTPEMTGLIDRDRERAAAKIVAEEADPVLAAARDAAAAHGVWLHIGSLALRGRRDGRLLNRAFVIDPTGAIRARYDKLHLFDVDLATGERWRESAAYAPGEGAAVVATPAGRIGLSICYDIRFPDLYRALTDAGAEILSIPAAFTVPTGEAHWHLLLRARAVEAGCWVVAAAQSGRHEDGRETYGHSVVVDPWGEVVLDMATGEGVGFVEIELGRIDAVRSRLPAIRHRRAIPPVTVVS